MSQEILYDYVEPVDPNLTCAICQSALVDPVTTTSCKHTFCRDCITRAIGHNPQCPIDRSALTVGSLRDTEQLVKLMLDELKVKCAAEGCGVVLQRGLLLGHLRACPKAIVTCQDGDCGLSMSRHRLQHHRAYECFQRKMECKKCGTMLVFKDRTVHAKPDCCGDQAESCGLCGETLGADQHMHQWRCPQVRVPCPHATRGCASIIPRSTLTVHLATCPFELFSGFFEINDTRLKALEEKNGELQGEVERLRGHLGRVEGNFEATRLGQGAGMGVGVGSAPAPTGWRGSGLPSIWHGQGRDFWGGGGGTPLPVVDDVPVEPALARGVPLPVVDVASGEGGTSASPVQSPATAAPPVSTPSTTTNSLDTPTTSETPSLASPADPYLTPHASPIPRTTTLLPSSPSTFTPNPAPAPPGIPGITPRAAADLAHHQQHQHQRSMVAPSFGSHQNHADWAFNRLAVSQSAGLEEVLGGLRSVVVQLAAGLDTMERRNEVRTMAERLRVLEEVNTMRAIVNTMRMRKLPAYLTERQKTNQLTTPVTPFVEVMIERPSRRSSFQYDSDQPFTPRSQFFSISSSASTNHSHSHQHPPSSTSTSTSTLTPSSTALPAGVSLPVQSQIITTSSNTIPENTPANHAESSDQFDLTRSPSIRESVVFSAQGEDASARSARSSTSSLVIARGNTIGRSNTLGRGTVGRSGAGLTGRPMAFPPAGPGEGEGAGVGVRVGARPGSSSRLRSGGVGAEGSAGEGSAGRVSNRLSRANPINRLLRKYPSRSGDGPRL